MYLFSRGTIAALGRQFDAIPAAIEVGAMVTKITGREVNVFTARFGAPQGSVMWSSRADSLTDQFFDILTLRGANVSPCLNSRW